MDEGGQATYRVPIAVTPGVAGVAPDLALVYSSQAGDGPAGYGWSVSGSSQIGRCRRTFEHGDPLEAGNYLGPEVSFSADDVFCLDGQRLFLEAGEYGAAGSEYRAELDPFTRITAVGGNNSTDPGAYTGPLSFRVERRDGTIQVYGGTVDSRLAVFACGGLTGRACAWRQWALSRVEDSNGNYLEFAYAHWNNGVTASAGSAADEMHLAEVRYTGKRRLAGQSAPDAAPFARVAFSYAARPTNAQHAGFQSGVPYRLSQELTGVGVFEPLATTVRHYALEQYDAPSGSGRRLLQRVRECADASLALCYPATEFGVEPAGHVLNESVERDFVFTSSGPRLDFRIGDVDGDGRQDIAWASNHPNCPNLPAIHVAFGSHTGVGAAAQPNLVGPSNAVFCLQRPASDLGDSWHLFDYDGDGREDLVFAGADNTRWRAHRSLGRPASGLAPTFSTTDSFVEMVPVGVGRNMALAQLIDFNGDGLLDIAYPVEPDPSDPTENYARLVVRLGIIDRSGPAPKRAFGEQRELQLRFAQNDLCATPRPAGSPRVSCTYQFGRSNKALTGVDLDGDGRGDLMLRVSRSVFDGPPPRPGEEVEIAYQDGRESTVQPAGNLIESSEAWYLFSSAGVTNQRVVLDQYAVSIVSPGDVPSRIDHVFLADLNGDGLQDFAYIPGGSTTQLKVRLNTGDGLRAATVAATDLSEVDYLQLVDLTGDGRADVVHPVGLSGSTSFCGGSSGAGQPRPMCLRRSVGAGADLTLASGELLTNLHAVRSSSGAGSSLQNFDPIFLDLDGDAHLEFVRLSRSISPSESEARIVRRAARYTARDAVTRITDGFGAETRIHYQPLTNRAVYRPGKTAWAEELGRGAPVFDLLSPLYVVAAVESSAPLRGQPDARTATAYRYSTARMQAGGRGFLGFAAIDTFDTNEVSTLGQYGATRSTYRQDFPFVGAPSTTQRAIGGGAPSLAQGVTPGCRQHPEAASDCFSTSAAAWTDSPIGLRDGDSGAGARLLNNTVNVYESLEFGVQVTCPSGDAAFATDAIEALVRSGQSAVSGRRSLTGLASLATTPVLLGTLEEGFSATSNSLAHERLSVSYSLFCYEDGYGNLTRGFTDVRDPASGFSQRLHFTTTTSAFDNGNPLLSTQPWRLGRMTQSSVEKTLRPQSATPEVSVRKAHFSYDLTSPAKTGQLLSERAEVNGTHATRTLYTLDDYGNRTAAFVCSDFEWDGSTLTDAECRDASRVRMRPTQVNGAPTSAVHRYTRTEFDGRGRYPVRTYAPFFAPSATNEIVERVTEHVLTRNVFGQVTHSRDTNGRNVYARFGAMGRAFATELQGGGTAVTRLRLCGGAVSCPVETVYRQHLARNDGPQQWSYHDRLGRAVLTVSESFEAGSPDRNFTAACTFSDIKARPLLGSAPFFLTAQSGSEPAFGGAGSDPCGAASVRYAEKRHDLIGRPTSERAADNSSTVFSYSGQTIQQTNALGQRTWEVRNVLGQVVSEIQADPANPTQQGMAVAHEYDAEGQLRFTRRNAGAGEIVHERRYDPFGRLERSLDPDRGVERFEYNAAGEVIRRFDAGGQSVEQHYDAQGRLWRRETGAPRQEPPAGSVIFASGFELPGTSQVRQVDLWEYDTAANGVGQLASEERQNPGEPLFRRVFTYDGLGRAQQTATLIQGVTRTATTTYDSLGRIWLQTDATGGVLEQVYTARGFVEQLRNGNNLGQVYNRVLEVNARGQVTRERRGDSAAMEVTRHYDALRGWLTLIDAGSGQSVQKLRYQFDVLGRLEWRDDQRLNQRETFGYDGLNRLRSAQVQLSGMNPLQTLSLTYDALGNLCSKNGTLYTYAGRSGCAGSAGQAAASPHAVTAIGGRVIHYHSQGHMRFKTGATTAQDRYTEFNGLEQLVLAMVGSVFSPSAELQLDYAPGGDRYLRRDRTSAGLTTTRIWGSVEEVIRPNGTVETRRYLAGAAIETKQGSSFNAGTPELRYLFTDHLGSLDVIANAAGGVIERLSFDAHGRRRQVSDWTSSVPPAASSITPRGFTGHEHLDAYGLIHMNGRVYDPDVGRFLQPDPMLDAGIQGLNRYSYVLNNPLSLTDPTGYLSVGQIMRIAAAVLVTWATGGAAAALWAGGSVGGALTVAALGGAFATVLSTGSTKGAGQGAFSAMVFFGIGSYFESAKWAKSTNDATKLSGIGRTAKIVAHGVTGGVLSDVQGGKFAHGFFSAGFSEAAGPLTAGVKNDLARGVLHALVGGTASELSGGKFSNGAVTGAMSFAFGQMAQSAFPDDGAITGSRAGARRARGVESPDSYPVIGRMAADGHGPPAPFDSIEEAARAGLDAAYPLGRTYEYAGAVVSIGDGYMATNPVTIRSTENFGFKLPAGMRPAALYHTHPVNANGAISLVFSGNDVEQARTLGVRSFIGVYHDSSIRVFDPSTMRPVSLMSFGGSRVNLRDVSEGERICSNCFR